MKFKKLALAAAVAALPATGFSMEAMEDSALSGVTGQDGIVVDISANIAADVVIHDKGGFTGYANDGAIVLDGFSIDDGAGGNASIRLDIDAGDSAVAGTAPILQVAVSMPTGVTINTGTIKVANSERDDGTPDWGWDAATEETIIDPIEIALGAGTSLNIQLGNELQSVGGTNTNMIALSSTITGGLKLGDATDPNNNLAIVDAATAGSNAGGGRLGASEILITDAGATNLTTNVGIDVSPTGLVVDMSGSAPMDIKMSDVILGDTAGNYLGDVAILGLDMSSSTVTISGK